MTQKVFLVSANRSPIGGFGGSLSRFSPGELGAFVIKDTCSRARISDVGQIEEVIVGNVLGAGHGMNVARQVALKGGLPVTVPAYTVNMVCGSGLKAVALGATEIALGHLNLIIAGGVEVMSTAGHINMGLRSGVRLGHSEMRDLILQDGLTDVFHGCHMGLTAENLAERYSITRSEQDEFALDSQKKAAAAISAGHFKDEISPVVFSIKGKEIHFEVDEYPRADSSLEGLSKLSPVFKKDGTVTAGNASGINDGAAFVCLASEAKVKELGLDPLAEIVGWDSGGVAPEVMGIGPVEAVNRLLKNLSMSLDQIDLIEANEAFAAQALAVNKLVEWDVSKVNPCGGAIALGHPIGASGSRILVTLAYQLRRLKKKVGLATLCVGGGQGIAMMIKAV